MEGWGSKAGLGRAGEPTEVTVSFVFLASVNASLYCKHKKAERNSLFIDMSSVTRHGS